MRGSYTTTHDDRRKFFHGLCELCNKPIDWYDLESTQLSMHNCVELLGELGYEQTDWDVNGWEGDVWGHYIHYGLDGLEDAPKMWVRSEAYSGELSVGFSGMDNGEEINTEALKELMRKHWGKYFPVI